MLVSIPLNLYMAHLTHGYPLQLEGVIVVF